MLDTDYKSEESEIDVSVKQDDNYDNTEENQYSTMSNDELITMITGQNSKLKTYEDQLKHSLADFANLQKRIQNDIEVGINNQIDKLFLDFLQLYDDFLRARDSYSASGVDVNGLNGILKNMDAFLTKYNVESIDALGEIFDPNFHEAISMISDPTLDEDTITKEIRKGYISHNRVIRPALVEIAKKEK